MYANDDDDEDERQPVDAKIQKEMNEISKIKDESGLGSVIFHELAERQSRTTKAMNPWKASRVPSAKYEPQYDTRFQSPMFACECCMQNVCSFTPFFLDVFIFSPKSHSDVLPTVRLLLFM